ncbi:MAG TPA: glutathione S-transferase family protein [Noviherbaspirillum sp.]|jgi:glutathione S-transferase|uniref:glutathione S-transferase family protein n=1 Tax=Noviherbaspirillum sp. TaxID=1926288 RepID=UPI002F94F9A2
MIILYKFGCGEPLGLPDMSPFVMKAEMLLKLAGLPYTGNTDGFFRSPRGKLPYIDDGGTVVSDSTLIRWHIEQRYGFDFDAGLTPQEQAQAWTLEKMLEDHLYWILLDARWNDDRNFSRGPACIFDAIPAPLRPLVKVLARRKMASNLRAHGMGRYTGAERTAFAARGFASLSAILGEKEYLFGRRPCGADATAFAFVAHALCPLFETPSRDAATGFANLVAYRDRMLGRYFPELAGQQIRKLETVA